jgi:hypothetical protein
MQFSPPTATSSLLSPNIFLFSNTLNLSSSHNMKDAELRGQMVNTPASYSGCLEFESRPGDQLPQLRFHGFPQFLQANAGIVL